MTHARTRLVLLIGATLAISAGASHAEPHRAVSDGVLESSANPAIRVRVDDSLTYVGAHPIRIRDVAEGERHIFVSADAGRVTRMLIFQFEHFLPDNDRRYGYDFSAAETIGGHRFLHNTWAFSNRAAAENNPNDEAARTAAFLSDRGYRVEDEHMMSRFVTVPDDERRHELILFYIENVAATGHRIEDFYTAERETPVWREISTELTERSRRSFEVLAED